MVMTPGADSDSDGDNTLAGNNSQISRGSVSTGAVRGRPDRHGIETWLRGVMIWWIAKHSVATGRLDKHSVGTQLCGVMKG